MRGLFFLSVFVLCSCTAVVDRAVLDQSAIPPGLLGHWVSVDEKGQPAGHSVLYLHATQGGVDEQAQWRKVGTLVTIDLQGAKDLDLRDVDGVSTLVSAADIGFVSCGKGQKLDRLPAQPVICSPNDLPGQEDWLVFS